MFCTVLQSCFNEVGVDKTAILNMHNVITNYIDIFFSRKGFIKNQQNIIVVEQKRHK